MSYITTTNINAINAELSNYCNAACPMCSRFDFDLKLRKDVTNDKHTSLELFKEKIGDNIIKNLWHFYSCGTYGDGSMNPQALEIFEYITKTNNKCWTELYTNGGARTEDFWYDLGTLGVEVLFHIDGLEDTNHLYRRNVNWEKLMRNVKAFVRGAKKNSRSKAGWRCFIFKHNEHQKDDIKKLAKDLGIENVGFDQTERWRDYDYDGTYREIEKLKVDDYVIEMAGAQKQKTEQTVKKDKYIGMDVKVSKDVIDDFKTRKIKCLSNFLGEHPGYKRDNHEIYIMAKGWVTPCCWIGDPTTHESQKLLNVHDDINLNMNTLDYILRSQFFKKLEGGINGTMPDERLQACYSCCGVK
jgi:MoaA/NifB/PqqE/SkfB family radical SAM enzyme